ncbi:hypothetical protein ACFVTY_33095 [Streptomyces sp. NPDC058067]|uniref:hypothetical protein n=1 Tax=Streptomyces sp. NPDC058067 TaxID=3346324 RepID=UPI0036E5B138
MGQYETDKAKFEREQALAHVARAGAQREAGWPVFVVNARIIDSDVMAEVIYGIEERGWALDKMSTDAFTDTYGRVTQMVFMVFRAAAR